MMARSAAVPFFFKRSDDAISGVVIMTSAPETVTSVRETVHGLLRLQGDDLIIQWRLATKTMRVGRDIRSDHEVNPVREIIVPVARVAGALVRGGAWKWPLGPRLVLVAADLTALEGLAGKDGLSLEHPAQLVLRLRRSDRLLAEEFCAELALAIAEIGAAEEGLLLNRKPKTGRSRLVARKPDKE